MSYFDDMWFINFWSSCWPGRLQVKHGKNLFSFCDKIKLLVVVLGPFNVEDLVTVEDAPSARTFLVLGLMVNSFEGTKIKGETTVTPNLWLIAKKGTSKNVLKLNFLYEWVKEIVHMKKKAC